MTNIIKNYEEASLYTLSSYETVQDMDRSAIEMNKVLNAKEYELLNYIRQKSAARSIGVVPLKHETISEGVGRSVSTVKRYLKRLTNKGALIIENSIRPKTKGLGANIYVVPSLAYFRKTYKAYVKKQNELSELTYRNEQENGRQSQQSQDVAYIRLKKPTMNFNHYISNILCTTNTSNKISSREVSNYQERQNNINNARIKPSLVPDEIYQQFKAFFSDAQLLRLYKVTSKEIYTFTYGRDSLDHNEQIEVITNALNSLVRALKRANNGGNKVQNIFNYAKSVAYISAFNLTEYGTLDRFSTPPSKQFVIGLTPVK